MRSRVGAYAYGCGSVARLLESLGPTKALDKDVTERRAQASGKKKAHKHKLFCPVGPSFHRICPRDKPSLSLGQIR